MYNFLLGVPKPPESIKTTNRYDVLKSLEDEEDDFTRPGADIM